VHVWEREREREREMCVWFSLLDSCNRESIWPFNQFKNIFKEYVQFWNWL
jgi:hypothetical protein